MFILFHFRLHQICYSQCLKSGSWEYICPLTTGLNRINLFKFKYKCLIKSIHLPQSVTSRKESFYCSLKHHFRTACTQGSFLGQTLLPLLTTNIHSTSSCQTEFQFCLGSLCTQLKISPSKDWPWNPEPANEKMQSLQAEDFGPSTSFFQGCR